MDSRNRGDLDQLSEREKTEETERETESGEIKNRLYEIDSKQKSAVIFISFEMYDYRVDCLSDLLGLSPV